MGEYTTEGFVVLFPSPGPSAMALMGRSANGWIDWMAANGKTLDELKRQAVGASG